MNKNICLVGNPNCGKTTLFNALTGTYQKTGNWSGVTTESKTGVYKKDKKINITDLPGIYSLSAFSEDENAALNYLKKSKTDVIINVIDGTNLERNLFLTYKLSQLNIPVIIAINLIDELNSNGIKINYEMLSKIFNVPVVGISAKKGTNIEKLIKEAITATNKIKINFNNLKFENNNVYNKDFNIKFDKNRINNKQNNVTEKNNLTEDENIYKLIEEITKKTIIKRTTKSEVFTLKADKLLLSKIFGIPIFFLVITLVYFLSINLGKGASFYIKELFEKISVSSKLLLQKWNINTASQSLICDAVIKGIGSVVSFMPQILVLYALMSIIEESGYAARVTFLFDNILRTFGLGGRSIIPFVLSCGCTVTGIAATRTIENKNEKYMTIFLCPNMPCGAKTAVFGWFAFTFFNGSALIAASMYFISLFSVVIFGKILKLFKPFKNSESGFLIEIPLLRMPSIKDIFLVMLRKTKEFLIKAGSLIFAVSIIIWILTNIGIKGYTYGKVEDSFLYYIGNILKYIFYPLGIKSWECSVAVITGILAKEAVIETLTLLSFSFSNYFDSYFAIYALMTFILLAPPCIATLSSIKRELKDNKLFIKMIIFELVSAYSLALIINLIGILFSKALNLILSLVFVIIILVLGIKCLIKTTKCGNCEKCKKKICMKKIKRNTTI